MAENDPTDLQEPREDTLYRHSLREAIYILSLWACCLVYTVTYCYLYGFRVHEPHPDSTGPAVGEWLGPLTSFDRLPESLTTPLGLGIPDWVLHGIVAPWLLSIVLSFGFCLFLFAEDDLGEAEVSPGTEERSDG